MHPLKLRGHSGLASDSCLRNSVDKRPRLTSYATSEAAADVQELVCILVPAWVAGAPMSHMCSRHGRELAWGLS